MPDEKQQPIIFDLDTLQEKLTQTHPNEESVVLKNEMLGLSILLQSSKKSATKLLLEAEKSFVRILKSTPTRIPLGVN